MKTPNFMRGGRYDKRRASEQSSLDGTAASTACVSGSVLLWRSELRDGTWRAALTCAMAVDQALITMVNSAVRGVCELCGSGATASAAMSVTHTRGGAVSLLACERCAHALRRLAAAVGSSAATFGSMAATGAAPAATRTDAAEMTPSVLVMRFQEDVVAPNGASFVAEVHGQARADGSWIGWLDFVDVKSGAIRRTGQETSQPDQGALAYWATGLAASYLEGAFTRARAVG